MTALKEILTKVKSLNGAQRRLGNYLQNDSSALLLSKAKDNNASAALGPFLRLFDAGFDLDACRAWFADQGVAKFKTPERIVRVDELPVLPSGKPDRGTLRERLG